MILTSKSEVGPNRWSPLSEEYVEFYSTPTPKVWHDAGNRVVLIIVLYETLRSAIYNLSLGSPNLTRL